ncbi:MAG: glycosyltransferase family 2 protein [Henriciella sp.]|nr:glycosyltransferase family 2 protein [Henriciella sp.]
MKSILAQARRIVSPRRDVTPKISIIIMSYNMAREVPRTVMSFMPPYQVGVSPEDVEIIVMDNGSPRPIVETVHQSWPDSVRYKFVENAHPSPARALNEGVAMSTAPLVCPVIDGARMASPGLLKWGLEAASRDRRAFASTAGFHLGETLQQIAVEDGYCQEVEDELLASINWPENGYRLFEICALAGSSRYGWFGYLNESNAPILPRVLYEELGGYDEAFDIPGGGLVNLDFLNRLLRLPDTTYYSVLGEGTFHQFHHGVTTSRRVIKPEADGVTTWEKYTAQYRKIRGEDLRPPNRKPILIGQLPAEANNLAALGLDNLIEGR